MHQIPLIYSNLLPSLAFLSRPDNTAIMWGLPQGGTTGHGAHLPVPCGSTLTLAHQSLHLPLAGRGTCRVLRALVSGTEPRSGAHMAWPVELGALLESTRGAGWGERGLGWGRDSREISDLGLLLSHFYTQRGARTHNPDIRSHALHSL